MASNREAPLLAREALGADYHRLVFRHPEIAREGRAGQFVMMKAGTSAAPPLRRPFSIMNVDVSAESFSLLVKGVGPGSRALSAMGMGEVALCLGPLGRPFTPPPHTRQALLVAGGYGIAPFVLFSRELVQSGAAFHIFYGGRGAADLPLRAAFEERSLPLDLTTEDGSVGRRGQVTDALEDHLDRRPQSVALYACGPHAMLHAVARIAAARRIPTQVSLDPWMGCGMGSCLGCVVRTQGETETRPKYRCACTDGPVFDASTVVWSDPSQKTEQQEHRS